MRSVFFLAAGFGTRLRPLTDRVPKALVPVGNQPQLLRLARRYADAHLVVNAHHEAEQIVEAAAAFAARYGVPLQVSREAGVLGTAGGVRRAQALFTSGPVLVHNADIEVAEEAVRAGFDAIDERVSSVLLVGTRRAPGEGNVGVDAAGRIVRLRTVRVGEEAASCNYLGVAMLAPALLEVLPEAGCLVADGWIPALQRGARLDVVDERWGALAEASFFDLGTPSSYLAANLAWLRQAGLRVRAEAGARVHEGAEDVVVGAGAVVSAPARRVVLWPGARLDEALEDAIVTPTHTLRCPPAFQSPGR